ncbi:class I SAM-dependent methyltransferase [Aerococcus sp. 1KP-2016]|uniref:class I SAM-dependent methyltransferase n=1 Tax=Aerococcus sp. 1KP-2016 TaxID=1981982 RepID=UPI000B996949|nr:class I SAM-dependent methyltransferase [Aerococcus sp. 1KP-2016]OYQ66322.1 16S rRNA methyltransferase [Aerococcus sp. 1KP-2016]
MKESHQYFENNEDLGHDIQSYETVIFDKQFKFTTDSGVFSRGNLDFGTRVMLEALDLDSLPEGDILDLGAGYGPVGVIMGTVLPDRHIYGVDISERAIGLAKQNAANNHVDNVEFAVSDVYADVDKKDFAVILTNPPVRAGKETVHHFMSEAIHYLKPGGEIYVVLQKKQGAPSAMKKLEEVFGNVAEIERRKGYWILRSVKE